MKPIIKSLVIVTLMTFSVSLFAAPTITNVFVTATTSSTATITWMTSDASTSQLKFGTSPGIPFSNNVVVTPVTSHSMTLTLLQPGPLYYVAAVSTDGSGTTQSPAITFALCDGNPMSPIQGTVNNYYQYGSYTLTWVPPSGSTGMAMICGQPVTTTVTGILDGGASFSAQVADASKIVPGPGEWEIETTDAGNLAPVTVYAYVSLAQQSVTGLLQAAAATSGLQACLTNTNTTQNFPSTCGGGGGGGGNTYSNLTSGYIPLANGAHSIISSLLADNGATLNYAGANGITVPSTGGYGLGSSNFFSLCGSTPCIGSSPGSDNGNLELNQLNATTIDVFNLAIITTFQTGSGVTTTFNGSVNINGGLLLSSSAGTSGQVPVSQGPGHAPIWGAGGGGGMVYPGAGVANSTGSAWATSYAVGTSANDLVQLNSSAQLPAVSGALLTSLAAANLTGTLSLNTTGTATNLSGTPALPNGTTATTQTTGDGSNRLATDQFVLANQGITALTGDVTASGGGSVASTVVRLNGVALSSINGLINSAAGTISQATTFNLSGSGQLGTWFADGTNSVAFSATPVFNAGLGNNQTLTLTGNVTSSSITGAVSGEPLTFRICQDATGGRSFFWPSNFAGFPAVTQMASGCTSAIGWYDAGESLVFGDDYNAAVGISSASPAVDGSATKGFFVVPAGSSPTLQVNTAAVFAMSQILLTIDQSIGAQVNPTVTCGTSTPSAPQISARNPGVSFTIVAPGTITGNLCGSWTVINP